MRHYRDQTDKNVSVILILFAILLLLSIFLPWSLKYKELSSLILNIGVSQIPLSIAVIAAFLVVKKKTDQKHFYLSEGIQVVLMGLILIFISYFPDYAYVYFIRIIILPINIIYIFIILFQLLQNDSN